MTDSLTQLISDKAFQILPCFRYMCYYPHTLIYSVCPVCMIILCTICSYFICVFKGISFNGGLKACESRKLSNKEIDT